MMEEMEDIWPAIGGPCVNCTGGPYDISSMLNDTIISFTMSNNSVWHNATEEKESDYLNVTKEFPIDYAIPLYGYVLPFLLLITIVANTLIVVVLSKRHMRTPTNAVLMAMALSDMFTLLFPSPWLFYMYTFGNHYKPLSPVSACFAWDVMNEVIPSLFHTASIWLTLALAVQRYIYVCHAPVARTWCTMPRVLRCIGLIICLAILHQSSRFLDRVYIPITITWRGQPQVPVCKVDLAPWVYRLTPNVYFTTYFAFRVIFVHVGPCISLVGLNLLLFRALRKAQKKRDKLFKENRKSECKRLRDSNCTTLMLIVVVTVFLITEIPLAVVTGFLTTISVTLNLWMSPQCWIISGVLSVVACKFILFLICFGFSSIVRANSPSSCGEFTSKVLHVISSSVTEILDYSVANVLVLFTNFFIIISYPINFAIYCGMSRQFRETFKELFIRGAVQVTRRNGGGSSKYSLVNGPRTCTNETVL